MKKLAVIASLVAFLGLTSCQTQHISTIQLVSYSQQKNTTTLTVSPFGSVAIPGHWKHTSYDPVSKQYFFKSGDTTLGIAFGPLASLPNRKEGESAYSSLLKFYEWDSSFLADKWKASRRIIKAHPEETYLIWELKNETIERHFLFGARGKSAFTFLIYSSSWEKERKLAFLQDLAGSLPPSGAQSRTHNY